MTQPRQSIVDLATTPYYHCMSRCVRRAFLCGYDHYSQQNYDHRKDWIVERLGVLSQTFSIHVLAYAALSNHLHIVIQVDETSARQWSDREVVQRWGRLYPRSMAAGYVQEAGLTPVQKDHVLSLVPQWRKRLCDVSWFMRSLNEWIARKANAEDGCQGRFWQGRFHSRALLDEAALLTCMAYVDLNPIRAQLAKTPESSDYTSIQQRIALALGKLPADTATIRLLPFADDVSDPETQNAVPMYRNDYFELVDWTGRAIREDKKGSIPEHLLPILERMNIESSQWLRMVVQFDQHFFNFAGSWFRLQQTARRLEQSWIKGRAGAKALYRPEAIVPS